MSEKITPERLQRRAMFYVRQSSQHQLVHNTESARLQYAMEQRVRGLGWTEVELIDEDQGRSATTTNGRTGFRRMVAEVGLGKVGAVAAIEVSRFARNNRDWHQLIEMCGMVDTLLIDHEAIYDPRRPNDRLLLGIKGSISEYEIDLLRQRSLEAHWAKARRGELVIQAPVGFLKTHDRRLEKDPDRRVQHAVELVFTKFFELGARGNSRCGSPTTTWTSRRSDTQPWDGRRGGRDRATAASFASPGTDLRRGLRIREDDVAGAAQPACDLRPGAPGCAQLGDALVCGRALAERTPEPLARASRGGEAVEGALDDDGALELRDRGEDGESEIGNGVVL